MADPLGIVVGYGSMGRRHANAFATLTPALYVVDAAVPARDAARRERPTAVVAGDVAELDHLGLPWHSAIAVIATWGPSHAAIFDALAGRGVRKILCEKPLATSVATADAMIRRATTDGVTLVSNHYFRNSGYVTTLRRLVDAHDFGAPLMMTVVGGAYCLVTNGIHCLDLAMQVFEAAPDAVMSTAHGDAINPRSKGLPFFDGSSTWRFGGGRQLTIALTNRSSVHPAIQIFFRDGIVDIDEWFHVTLRRRPLETRGGAVTRTGDATDVVFRGALPDVLSMEDALREGLTRLMTGTPSASPATAAAAALNACVGGLAAAREERLLCLPLTPDSSWGRQEWPIT